MDTGTTEPDAGSPPPRSTYDLAAELCERTIVMSGGKVLADGRTREIFGDDELLAASGLERPLGMRPCPVCGHGRGDSVSPDRT
jgi:hypothetical protein